jgi:hypothetical protein
MYSVNNQQMSNITLKPSKVGNPNFMTGFANNYSSNYEDDYILRVDVNSINMENISVELALNILRLNHTTYHKMSELEVIKYYNEKSKMTLSIEAILALKIIIKSKLKNSNNIVNSYNSQNQNQSQSQDYKLNDTNNQISQQMPNYNFLNKKNNTISVPLFETNNLAVPNVVDNLAFLSINNEREVKNNFKIIQNENIFDTNKTVMVNPYLKNVNEQVSYVPQPNILNIKNNNKEQVKKTLPNFVEQKNNNNNKFYDPPIKNNNISYQNAIPLADYDLDSIINNFQMKKNNGVFSKN